MELVLASTGELEKYFKEWRWYAEKICVKVKELLGDDASVIVFGSVVRGEWSSSESDIDILIISDKIPKEPYKQAELRVSLREFLGDLFAPFEFHLATWREYREWYSKFIDAEEKIC